MTAKTPVSAPPHEDRRSPLRRAVRAARRDGLAGLVLKTMSSGLWRVQKLTADARARADARYVERAIDKGSRDIVARNDRLRGKHAGRRAFVLANGPSLAGQDIRPLKDELTFVLNAFWKHPLTEEWDPTYYFFADPDLFDGSGETAEFFAQARSRCSGSTFFAPLSARSVIENRRLLPVEQTYFVAFAGRLHAGLRLFPDLARPLPTVQGVTQMAIMAAMSMGCSPIYLLGFDHDAIFRRAELQEGEEDRTPHFYHGPAIANRPNVWPVYSTETHLRCELMLYEGYNAIKSVADQHGVVIQNATDGGFLDVFPRVDYVSILGSRSTATG